MARRCRIALFCSLLLVCPIARGDVDDATEIPTVGQPIHVPFSKASGQFRVEAKAEPTSLMAEDPLTLRVIVRARAGFARAPERIRLDEMPQFDRQFFIKDLEREDKQVDPVTWEFHYQLRPKNERVREIPSIPLAFYDPDVPFPDRRFQIDYADPIPLKVLSRRVFQAEPPPLPEEVYQLRSGQALLSRESPPGFPGVLTIIMILLVPPVAAVSWYRIWLRCFPDAALMARRRRSQAASRALKELRRGKRLPPREGANLSAMVVARYLRERLDLPATEPTPLEVESHLRTYGCSIPLAEKASGFFRACDLMRFSSESSALRATVTDDAASIILAVETETWPAQS